MRPAPARIAILLALGLTRHVPAAPQVPAGLAAAAGAAPGVFADYLVEASIPAGIELRQADMPLTFPPKIAIDRTKTVAASDLVNTFNDRQRGYRAAVVDDVFVIRPVAGRAAYLDQLAPATRLRTKGLYDAARWLFAPLDPRLGPSAPHVPCGLGSVDEAGESVEIDVSTHGRTVLNLLNELVKKAPNHAWLALTTDGDATHVAQIGFIRPNAYCLVPISGRGRGR